MLRPARWNLGGTDLEFQRCPPLLISKTILGWRLAGDSALGGRLKTGQQSCARDPEIVLPHRYPFGQVLFSVLPTRPARPRPAGARRMASCFSFLERFLFWFSAAPRSEPRRGDTEGFTSTDSPTNSPNEPKFLPIPSYHDP